MGAEMRVLIIVGIATFFFAPVAYAAEGTATFYTPPYVPSSCNGFQDDGVMIAAVSDAIWDNRAACGRNYTVRCTGATNPGVPFPCINSILPVVVKVVEYCPPGCAATIELSQEAFSMIADLNAGKVNIEFNEV